MVPLAPKGSSNWFIDEVNAAISQGQVCVGFQWIAAMGGLHQLSTSNTDVQQPPLAADPKPAEPPVVAPGASTDVKPTPVDKWTDVLSLVDLRRESQKRGNWSRGGDGLRYTHEAGANGWLPLPVSLRGSYRWKIEISSR
jgi:multiple sugar transport system substrate-binding protein